jgi:2,3-bisphosphoglycerate-dependent phosphoglycerate mutase
LSRWIFLRHGESTANAARVFSGHDDVALTERGRTQAHEAGLQLKQVLADASDLIAISSTLQRALQTTQIALQAADISIPVQTFDALRERNLGSWQGMHIDALKKLGARDVLLRWDGQPPGGGESLRDLASRLLPCLADHDDGRTVLVGCHGGVVRTAVGLADGLSESDLCRWNVPNCEPQVRDYPAGIWASPLGDGFAP